MIRASSQWFHFRVILVLVILSSQPLIHSTHLKRSVCDSGLVSQTFQCCVRLCPCNLIGPFLYCCHLLPTAFCCLASPARAAYIMVSRNTAKWPAMCAVVALALLRHVAAKPNKYYMDPILKGLHSFVLFETLLTFTILHQPANSAAALFLSFSALSCFVFFFSSSVFLILLSNIVSALTSLLATFFHPLLSLQQYQPSPFIFASHMVWSKVSLSNFMWLKTKSPWKKHCNKKETGVNEKTILRWAMYVFFSGRAINWWGVFVPLD